MKLYTPCIKPVYSGKHHVLRMYEAVNALYEGCIKVGRFGTWPVNTMYEGRAIVPIPVIVPWHDRPSADGTISPGWHNVARYRAGEFNW